jgi:hypothetical protein
LGEVFGIRIGDDALRVVAERKFGVTKEGVVGRGDEPTGHLQDGIGRAGLDASGQFVSFGFLFGRQGLRHRDLLPE